MGMALHIAFAPGPTLTLTLSPGAQAIMEYVKVADSMAELRARLMSFLPNQVAAVCGNYIGCCLEEAALGVEVRPQGVYQDGEDAVLTSMEAAHRVRRYISSSIEELEREGRTQSRYVARATYTIQRLKRELKILDTYLGS